ncbi:CBS domain-containing protein [Streptomyces sp. NPDC051909]|uniref:CBS domain-containing protein n=1 Tax=Streptomyces sp. NPDC051909 TaxID=3154944 RepID=UPI00343A5616
MGEVMTAEVVQARPDTSFRELARLLAAHRVSGLPVVDEDDKVMGVVSQTDLSRWQARGGVDPADAAGAAPTAGRLMTGPAVTVHPEQRVVDAARIMERRLIGRLPVVDEADRLVGIVTRRDLLRVFLRSDEQIRADVVDAVTARVPAARDTHPLRIDVRDGVVTLLGRPLPAADVARVIRTAWRVDGVVGVVNRQTEEVPGGAR